MPKKLSEQKQEAISHYIQSDPFAALLGAQIEIPAQGQSRVTVTVKSEMANFHGLTHGGLIFSLSDIAFAAASNSSGQKAVALNVAINFLEASHPGDRLVAEAREVHAGGRTAVYDIVVSNADTGTVIARSQDLVYRKKEWFVSAEQEG